MNDKATELAAISWLRERWDGWVPDVGVVLGSGIELLDDQFHEEDRVPVTEIPGLPRPSVEGHGCDWIRYRVDEKKVLVLGGRVHLYEGYDVEEVTRGIRVLAGLGTKSLILTNAAGGIGAGFVPGTLVALTDHLQLQGIAAMAPRLEHHVPADGLPVYDLTWLERTRDRYQEISSESLMTGVYAALMGPVYETPAEINMLRKLGADMVGMSTVPEALVAREEGLDVVAFSLVTNLAAGISGQKLNHAEVLETGKKSQQRTVRVVRAAIEALD